MRHLGWMFAGVVVAAAVAFSPGSAAAAFIYSCTPAQGNSTGNTTVLFLNNAQIVTANVVVKVQAASGANLNGALGVTQNHVIAAGNTKSIRWAQPACTGFCDDFTQGTNGTTVPANVRVVSDVELGVGINVQVSGVANLYSCNQSGS